MKASPSNQSQDSKESSVDSESTKDDNEYIESVKSKSIILLQFQPEFEALLMVGIYVSCLVVLLDFTFAYSTDPVNIPIEYLSTLLEFNFSIDVIYIIDIFLMISYKKSEYEELKHIYPERRSLLVALDIISVIPLDAVYFSLTSANMRVLYFLRLRYLLRTFRFLHKYRTWRKNVRYNHLFVELLSISLIFSVYLATATCVVYYTFCTMISCEYRDMSQLTESCYFITTYLTHGEAETYGNVLEAIYFVTTLTSVMAIKGFGTGLILIAIAYQNKNKFMYDSFHQIMVGLIGKFNVQDELVQSTVKVYFELMWKHREGLLTNEFNNKILPEIMIKELKLDMYWDCLKHSHLFRDTDVSFLRFVSCFIVRKVMLPGEVIFKRGEYKTGMIYVSNGTIQILSEQDRESPIISFTRGTCMGETCLLLDYPSTSTVICQSYCELCVLRRKDFMNIIKHYPKECRVILRNVQNRYQDTRDTEAFLNKTFNDKNNHRKMLTLKWLKIVLKDLTWSDKEKAGEGVKTLSLEERRTLDLINANLYCATYLDMLVISEDIKLLTDSVFMKTSCPCILQPDSFVITIWNNIVDVTLVVFLAIFPYYAAFQPQTTVWYLAFSYGVTIMWVLDIYITLSTAIKTKHSIITDFTEIALKKWTNLTFLIDVAAALPLELLFHVLLGDMSGQIMVLLQFPRLLKAYRIFYLLKFVEPEKRAYLLFLIQILFMSYYLAAYLHLAICYNGKCLTTNKYYNFVNRFASGDPIKTLLMWVYLVLSQFCRLFLSVEADGEPDPLYTRLLIINIIAFVFFLSHMANIGAILSLKNDHKMKVYEHIRSIRRSIQILKLKPELQSKVMRHVQCQLRYNKGFYMLNSRKHVRKLLHPEILKDLKILTHSDELKSQRAFAGLPNELINAVAQEVESSLIVPGEVITYAGEMCYEMYIIKCGFCAILTDSGKILQVLKVNDSISTIEMFFQIPAVNTVVALTHCFLNAIKYDGFMNCVHLHPEVLLSFNKIVADVLYTVNMDVYETSTTFESVKMKTENNASFKLFGWVVDKDSKEAVDYYRYFDKHPFLKFLKCVLLRMSIRPYGQALMYWELSRCIFAYLTSFLVPITIVSTCYNCWWKYLLLVLDVTAWLDIYIRHHVGYFDTRGIEVTHPVKTAAHYWRHAFIVDLLGVLPFEITAPIFGITSPNRIVFFKFARCLQIYRFHFGLQFFDQRLITSSKFYKMVRYLPISFLFFSVISSIEANCFCDFDPAIPANGPFTDGVRCDSDKFDSYNYSKPISPERITLYFMLNSAEIIFAPIIGDHHIYDMSSVSLIILQAIFGHEWFMGMCGRLLAANTFTHSDLTSYQKSMATLIKFLSYRRIDPELKVEVIEHFEYVWKKTRNKQFNQTIDSTFSQALREDMLYDVYGEALSTTIFNNASGAFFRSILLNVKHKIFLKRGIICQVNSIVSDIFIVYKGLVDVLGPDYNRLLVLQRGSLFGNIDACPMSRQTLTLVAKGHVEVLIIPSTLFHKILSKYPRLKESFFRLIVLNTDYLSATPNLPEDLIVVTRLATTLTASTSTKSLTYALSGYVKPYITTLFQIWEIMILVVVYYVGTALKLYQFTVNDCSTWLTTILYFVDVLYIFHMALQFYAPFQNEYGILITDKKLIANAYLRDPLQFTLQLASTLPIEVVSLIYWQSNSFCRIFSITKANRVLRIFYLRQYFKNKRSQLNINVMVMHILEVLIWASLLGQLITFILISLNCLDEFNLSPKMKCNWEVTSAWEKLDVYFHQLRVVTNIALGLHVAGFVPDAIRLIVFFIILLVWSKLVIAMILGQITSTANSVLNDRYVYQHEVDMLHERMTDEWTSPTLLNRICDYVYLLWEKNDGIQYPGLLEDAPYYLREAVMNSMFGFHLRNHPVFSKCHVDLIRQISAEMVTRLFFTGDHVAFVNDVDECMYFVHEGSVSALSEDELTYEKVEYTYSKRSMFGLRQGIFKQRCHDYTYKAERYSILVVLERSKWIHLLDFFPASRDMIYSQINTT